MFTCAIATSVSLVPAAEVPEQVGAQLAEQDAHPRRVELDARFLVMSEEGRECLLDLVAGLHPADSPYGAMMSSPGKYVR
jgi:hypothetical protein